MSYYRAACHLNTFDEVVAHYNETKPLVSKHHTLQDDIRPIGARRRKWERVVKFSETEYGLTDGSYSDMYRGYNDPNYVKNMMPLLWERRPDGDYLRVRNYYKAHQGTARAEFICTFGPRGMYAYTERGRTYIQYNGVDYYLPKTEYFYNYSKDTTNENDDTYLWFKREGDKFVRANTITAPSTHIDKELKKELKPHLDRFFNWTMIMYPLVSAEYAYNAKWQELRGWVNDNGYKMAEGKGHTSDLPHEVLRDIVRDDDHPMRTTLMYLMFYDTRAIHWTGERVSFETIEDVRKYRASFNSWVNKVLKLYELTVY
jgi:hypothetical protein